MREIRSTEIDLKRSERGVLNQIWDIKLEVPSFVAQKDSLDQLNHAVIPFERYFCSIESELLIHGLAIGLTLLT